jgi:methyl-accepting chemotaxis protein
VKLWHKLLAAFGASALTTVLLVALSLTELRASRADVDAAWVFASRNAALRATLLHLAEAGVSAASLGLDLTEGERKEFGARARSSFQALIADSTKLGPDLADRATPAEKEAIERSLGSVRVIWSHFADEVSVPSPSEISFHLVALLGDMDRMRDALLAVEARNRAESEAAAADAARRSSTAIFELLIVSALGLAFSIAAIGLFLSRVILSPLRQVTAVITGLAEGRRETALPLKPRRDELGLLLEAARVFRDNAENHGAVQAEKEALAAERDLRRLRLEAEVEHFRREVTRVVTEAGAAADEMRFAAAALARHARDSETETGHASERSVSTSETVLAMARATEGLSSSSVAVGRQAAMARSAMDQATCQARGAAEQVAGLSEAAREIGQVTQLIQTIASQTNLLALNATIEAARAGEAGRGFAVVAGEVKALAGQTARAAEGIARQIGAVQAGVGEAVEAIGRVASVAASANAEADRIALAMGEQARSAAAINVQADQAVAWTGDLAGGMATLEDAMGRTVAAVADVRTASDRSAGALSRVNGLVDAFLAEVQAA